MKFISIFWLVFSVFLWGVIHSFTASHRFKAFIRRVFGPVTVDRFFRVAYNLFAVASFLVVLIIAAFIPDRTLYVVPLPWVALMIIVEFLAMAALVVGLAQTDVKDLLGVRQLTGQKKNQPSRLVRNGLYQYVRNPLYTAGIVFIWLIPLMTARLLVLDLALSVYVVVGAYFKERKLRQKFGQEYVEYAAVTPMFIPFIKRRHDRMGAQ